MNRIFKTTILFLGAATMGLSSCKSDEEQLLPDTEYNDNKFEVPSDATGPDADLRRDFYTQTGVYLLFTDLLDRVYVGTDAYGDEVWRDDRVDFNYNLTSSGSENPVFTELSSYEMRKEAADFIIDYVCPHIEGSSIAPFSFLLVNDIGVENYYGGFDSKNIYSCWRCMAVSIKLEGLDEEGKREYAMSLLKEIVRDRLDPNSRELDAFNKLSQEYSRQYIKDYDSEWDRTDMTAVYEKGYLGYYQYGSNPDRDYFYNSYGTNDFDDFFNAVMTRDKADFMKEFGDYPRIVEKYGYVRSYILGTGYKF